MKFNILRQPRPRQILKWKIFWKKEELSLQKMKIKIFNFLSKISTALKI